MATEQARGTRFAGEAVGLVIVSGLAVASLAFPLVTPAVAIPGAIISYLLNRRQRSTIFKVTFVIFALTLITALLIDTTLISVGTEIGHPTRVPAINP